MMRALRKLAPSLPAVAALALLSACSETQFLINAGKRVMPYEDSTTGGGYKIGNPYQINGVWYYPKVDYEYEETGIASWYGPTFHGKRTANGETFDQNIVSAAHRTLPLPSWVRVTNLDNGRSIKVRVNDRGPFAHGRIIDMSRQGAQLLGFHRQGTARVRVEVLAEESRQLAARLGAPQGFQVARADDGLVPPVQAAPRSSVTRADGQTPPSAGRRAPAVAASDSAIETAAVREPEVTRVPVVKTNMYIQAGAFADFDNANRLRARLSALGSAQVSQVQLGNQTLFRVRVGPVADLRAADGMLERVIRAGFGDARIIVDK